MTTILEKERPKRMSEVIGQRAIKEKLRDHVLEKDPEDAPNLYFRGTWGIGKTTIFYIVRDYITTGCREVELDGNTETCEECGELQENYIYTDGNTKICFDCRRDVARSSCLEINAGDEGVIDTIRGKVTEFCKTQSFDRARFPKGRKLVWFKEAYMISNKAVEMLKDTTESFTHVKWGYDSNKRIDEGLSRRGISLLFRPVPEDDIFEYLKEIGPKYTNLGEDDFKRIAELSMGKVAKAINMLFEPLTESTTRELFNTAVRDINKAWKYYRDLQTHPHDFLTECSVLVSRAEKLSKKVKIAIITEIADHYQMSIEGTPDLVVMNSILGKINDVMEWHIKQIKEEKTEE